MEQTTTLKLKKYNITTYHFILFVCSICSNKQKRNVNVHKINVNDRFFIKLKCILCTKYFFIISLMLLER